MIFTTNSPFQMVEHVQFHRMEEKLKSGYTPPTRQEVANKYLPMVYEGEYRKCANYLKNEWSNIHNEPSIYVNLTSPGHIYLVNTIDISGQLHIAEYDQEDCQVLNKEISRRHWLL